MIEAEIWDVLDEKGTPTGRTVTRGSAALKPGEYHLVVHIWVMTSKGQFLIQRRSDEKRLMPGEWAATGGAAISGEDSFSAARRELFEELGIPTDRDTLKFVTRLKRKNSLLDVWFTICDIPPEQLTLQTTEVAEVKLVTNERLIHMIQNENFHNYGEEYFRLIFNKIDALNGAAV